MFDYEHALTTSNEYIHMNSFVTANLDCPWTMQGALATIETNASAPALFFHNTDDYYKDSNKNPQGLYATQATLMKSRLDAVGTPTETLVDYSSGHAVPQTAVTLQTMYDFLTQYIPSPFNTGISPCIVSPSHLSTAIYDLNGRRVSSGNLKPGIYIINKKKIIIR